VFAFRSVSTSKRHLAQEGARNGDKTDEELMKTKSYKSLKNWSVHPLHLIVQSDVTKLTTTRTALTRRQGVTMLSKLGKKPLPPPRPLPNPRRTATRRKKTPRPPMPRPPLLLPARARSPLLLPPPPRNRPLQPPKSQRLRRPRRPPPSPPLPRPPSRPHRPQPDRPGPQM
jgi:hypothetical protein